MTTRRMLLVMAGVALLAAGPVCARWRAFVFDHHEPINACGNSDTFIDQLVERMDGTYLRGEWFDPPQFEMPQRFKANSLLCTLVTECVVHNVRIYQYGNVKGLASKTGSGASNIVAFAMNFEDRTWLDAVTVAASKAGEGWSKRSRDLLIHLSLRLHEKGVDRKVHHVVLNQFAIKVSEDDLHQLEPDRASIATTFGVQIKTMKVEAGHYFWGNDTAGELRDRAVKILRSVAGSTGDSGME